jgi:FtsP/CotA-like multicopper oxidase with cupredoxin domain
MTMDRRAFLQWSSLAAGSALVLKESAASAQQTPAAAELPHVAREKQSSVAASAQYAGGPAVITPNGATLPLKRVGNVKVGHLTAGPIDHEFMPGLRADCWGYNGRTPGPTIEVTEGDHVRFYVTNRLPEATTVHWHGILLPNGMDGVAGLTQRRIEPGETFKYEFTFNRAGTYMYHPHFDEMTQMAMGMVGMIVVHPRTPHGPRVDRDFVLMTHEWKIRVGTHKPDPTAMLDFNVLTFNSRTFPGTEALVVGKGERVRIRFGNLSAMDHHPIHLHGHYFKIVATDGGEIPASAQWPENTVLIHTGSTRTIEFIADAPGDWAMHCHMTHHTMNQMGHDIPVTIGADAKRINKRVNSLVPNYMTMGQNGMGGMSEMKMPIPENSVPMQGGPGPFGMIDMGGMFTILKVRDKPETDRDAWYKHPDGTVATQASAEDLEKDGIDV